LKSYTDSLKKINRDELLPETGKQHPGHMPRVPTPPGDPLDMDAKVAKARDYFDRLFKVYMSWSDNGRNLRPHFIGNWTYSRRNEDPRPIPDKPVFTHALLDTRDQKTSEPLRRSCLTGFELFYRHVALWEAEQDGKLRIRTDVWASTTVSASR
jgi:hypothetical protein